MGGGQSAEIGGVRVFKISPGSPAAEAGLEVFFDFILDVNGVRMDPNYQKSFAQKIQESENSIAKMQVFNTRAHTTREVTVMPRKWNGNGLLGATVRFDIVDPTENQGIRVLEVFPNSPAAHAGLVPYQDYLLGTAQCVFHDIDELVEVVGTSINTRLQVYVYNTDSESVREVMLVPNNDWGGEGCIGCDIGTGLLHKIPAPRRPPGATPGAPAMPPAMAPASAPALHAGIPPVPQAPAVPGAPPQGLPGIAVGGGWNGGAAAQLPSGAAYPPGAAPAPGVPGIPGVPGVPGGIPAVPGMPVVPGAPGGRLCQPVAAAPAPAAPAVTADGMAQLQAQMHQMAASNGQQQPPASGDWAQMQGQGGGVTWPPQPQPGAGFQAPLNLPAGAAAAGYASPYGMAPSPGGTDQEGPRAPYSTPINAADMPGPADFSGVMDPSKFGGIPEQPAEGGAALL